MGRGKGRGGRRTHKRDFRESRDPEWRYEKRIKQTDGTWGTHAYTNEAFEEFYKAQGIVPEGEWDDFLNTLRATLPTTFRINASTKFAGDLLKKMETDLFSHFGGMPIEVEGELVDPPKPLPWYPGKLAWQFNFSRQQLRKTKTLETIHEFVKRENECGTITRQEAVSMVPPLFLDVKPEHSVLDMCAAPGSKTFQLLEMLHSGSGIPKGLVVANDADAQRCNLLTHQTKRHCSPCLLVTNHEGQIFPNVKLPGQDDVMFDRVLCDVPCCGDGTVRKAPDIWKKWSVGNGIALHPLQIRITLQAARLLKVGGRLVYSTCTFNPIENEAVVAEVLRRAKGSLVLRDMTGHLPELKRNKGLTHWKVRDRTDWYDNYESIPKELCSKVTEMMFPQGDLKELNMEYCMRFLPHQQDTGGFFVCVLEKVSPTGKIEELHTKKERQAALYPDRAKRQAVAKAAAEAAAAAATAGTVGDAAELSTAIAAVESKGPQEGISALVSDMADNLKEQEAKSAPPVKVGQQSSDSLGSTPILHGNGLKVVSRLREDPRACLVADSSVKAQAGIGAVAHTTSVDSDAEGGVAVATGGISGATASTAGGPPRPRARVMGQSASSNLAPPFPLEPALSVGQSASADTVQATAAVAASLADECLSKNVALADSKSGQAATSRPPAPEPKPGLIPSWGARGGGGRNREGGGGKFKGMDPILPVNDTAILDSIYNFYGIPKEFPMRTQLVTRSTETGRPKRLYFVSASVCNLLAADEDEKLKIQATGVKAFERQEAKECPIRCNYRVAQEGLPFCLEAITKQIVYVSADTFIRLLKERSIPLPAKYRAPEGHERDEQRKAEGAEVGTAEAAGAAKVDGAEPVQEDKPAAQEGQQKEDAKPKAMMEDTDCLEQLKITRMGGCVTVLKEADMIRLGIADEPLAVSCWRGMSSISILVSKQEANHMVDKVESSLQEVALKQEDVKMEGIKQEDAKTEDAKKEDVKFDNA